VIVFVFELNGDLDDEKVTVGVFVSGEVLLLVIDTVDVFELV